MGRVTTGRGGGGADGVIEYLDSPMSATNRRPPTIRRSSSALVNLTGAESILNVESQLTTTFVLGRYWAGRLSNATTTTGFLHAAETRLTGWPVGQELELVPAHLRFVRRYELDLLLLRATPILDVPCGLVLGWSAASPLQNVSIGGLVGFEVSSRASVNGGRWTVYRRLVDAGVAESFDTGVAVDTIPHRLGFRYDHAIGPAFQVLYDGKPIFAFVGLPELPSIETVVGSSNQQTGIFQANPLSIAGQQDHWTETRYRIIPL